MVFAEIEEAEFVLLAGKSDLEQLKALLLAVTESNSAAPVLVSDGPL